MLAAVPDKNQTNWIINIFFHFAPSNLHGNHSKHLHYAWSAWRHARLQSRPDLNQTFDVIIAPKVSFVFHASSEMRAAFGPTYSGVGSPLCRNGKRTRSRPIPLLARALHGDFLNVNGLLIILCGNIYHSSYTELQTEQKRIAHSGMYHCFVYSATGSTAWQSKSMTLVG